MSRECICLPFVSNEIPAADQYRELRQSYRAIASVREPALAVPRASCLAYIEPVMNRKSMPKSAAPIASVRTLSPMARMRLRSTG